MKTKYIILIIVSTSIFVGCGYIQTTKEDGEPFGLMDHPNNLVNLPARIGGATGGIAGLPISVALVPIGLISDSRETAVALFVFPMLAAGGIGSEIIGRPFWLLFGWWEITDEDNNKKKDTNYSSCN